MIRTVENVIWYVSVALGIPGSILSAIVWLHRHVAAKNSSAIYLAALAISDLAFLIFNLISFMLGCDRVGWFCRCCAYLVYYASVLEPLLVLGFSVERLIAVVRPLQVCCMHIHSFSWVRVAGALDTFLEYGASFLHFLDCRKQK